MFYGQAMSNISARENKQVCFFCFFLVLLSSLPWRAAWPSLG